MNHSNKLLAIKLIHTFIWLFFVAVLCYIIFSALTGRINILTWIGIGIIIAEGIVLLVFKMLCPFTVIARRYSDAQNDNFDIFLPNWLAKYNKIIFTSIFLIALIIIMIRII